MKFVARGLNSRQEIVTVSIDAHDAQAARQKLELDGLSPISIASAGRSAGRTPRFPLTLFAEELHALLNAGLSVPEALDALLEKQQSAASREVIEQLRASLNEGLRLSAAMALQPQAFPALFVSILQAAENSSDLVGALSRYLAYESRLTAVRDKIVSAAIYPLILLLVGGGVAAFLMGYVVPRFATVYRSSGRPLPWASELLLDWGHLAAQHATPLAAAFAFVVLGVAFWLRGHVRNGTWWRLLGVIPGAAPKLEALEISRLYLTLGTLLQGGLPVVQSLKLAQVVLPPRRVVALERARRVIEEGTPLSEAFADAGLSAAVALRLLKVGERTGQLGDMLVRAAAYHEGEATRWLERFTKVFEPALMAGIGLVIGTVVVLLYMPIFDLAGSLQ